MGALGQAYDWGCSVKASDDPVADVVSWNKRAMSKIMKITFRNFQWRRMFGLRIQEGELGDLQLCGTLF